MRHACACGACCGAPLAGAWRRVHLQRAWRCGGREQGPIGASAPGLSHSAPTAPLRCMQAMALVAAASAAYAQRVGRGCWYAVPLLRMWRRVLVPRECVLVWTSQCAVCNASLRVPPLAPPLCGWDRVVCNATARPCVLECCHSVALRCMLAKSDAVTPQRQLYPHAQQQTHLRSRHHHRRRQWARRYSWRPQRLQPRPPP